MRLKKKIVVCFSVTVFVVLLIASEVLVHGGTVQTTPGTITKDIQKYMGHCGK